jgi:type VI secretion system secreted protein VgrG
MNFGLNANAVITGIFQTPGSSAKGDPFELRAGPFVAGELRVLSLRGRERVNDAYCYEVTFATEVPPDLVPISLFGTPACLAIKAPGFDPHVIQGLTSSVEALGGVPGEQGGKRRRFRVEIVPKLWLLKRRRKNRIFQNKSVVEIVQTLLDGVKIADAECHWRVHAADYPKLPFVYQRAESDYDFFRRILASAGIFFYFEHASGFLDSLLPGASAVAGLAGTAAGMIGGAVGGAVESVEASAKLVTVLNFGSDAGHTPAVTSGLAGGLANAAIGGILHDAAGALGGSVAASFIAEDPSDAIAFDDGAGADTNKERIYEFGLKKSIRTKSLRFLDRNVEASSNWVGVAGATTFSVGGLSTDSLTTTLGAQASLSLGPGGLQAGLNIQAKFDVDAPNLPASELRQERYQVDPNVRQDKSIDDRMEMELGRLRRKYVEAEGKSDSRRLGAAYRFILAGHPIAMLNDEYTVTALDVEGVHPDFAGEADAVYRNRFRCIPSNLAPRPKRPKRMPKPGLELATVVNFVGGSALPGLEASACGYVRVRFRWQIADDRGTSGPGLELGSDDANAAWIPLVQPWAGAGYGAQFIPREGMEVLVGFLEGQSERPVILGCLYSQASPPPWGGTIENQKVGILSRTRPENGGYSEISIDDRQDGELVCVRAQRDLDIDVVVDSRATVGNDQEVTVTHDSTFTVGVDSNTTIGRDQTYKVGGDSKVEISGDSTVTVNGASSTTVQGSSDETIEGDFAHTVSGRLDATTEGEQAESYADNYTARHAGHRVVVVGSGEVHRSATLHVEGSGRAYASKFFEVVTLEGFTLTCGKSQIRIAPEMVTISSPKLAFVSQEMNETTEKYVLSAKDKISLSGQTLSAAGSGASLTLDSGASMTGSQVKLAGGSGSSAQDDKKKKVTKVTVTDPDGKPLADQRVLLRTGGENGEERMVVLDAKGEFEVESDDAFEVVFPDLVDAKQG